MISTAVAKQVCLANGEVLEDTFDLIPSNQGPAKGLLPVKSLPAARKGNWSLTFSGVVFYPMDPRTEDIRIADIAHSLAMQCRYGGHSRKFYSVAEHSVILSRLVPKEHALVALMHDATEAYVSDVPRPLKAHLPNYASIEGENWKAISEAFDLPWEIPECVHDLDTRICITEMQQLMPICPLPLGIKGPAPDVVLSCWSPAEAETMFHRRFRELWDKRNAAKFPAAYGKEVAHG